MNSDAIITTTITLFPIESQVSLFCLILRGISQIPSLITAACSRSQIRLKPGEELQSDKHTHQAVWIQNKYGGILLPRQSTTLDY